MGLSKPHYGIHGTNNPSSIGKNVSHGCIRMYNRDVLELASKVPIGTKVVIHKWDFRAYSSGFYSDFLDMDHNFPNSDHILFSPVISVYSRTISVCNWIIFAGIPTWIISTLNWFIFGRVWLISVQAWTIYALSRLISASYYFAFYGRIISRRVQHCWTQRWKLVLEG